MVYVTEILSCGQQPRALKETRSYHKFAGPISESGDGSDLHDGELPASARGLELHWHGDRWPNFRLSGRAITNEQLSLLNLGSARQSLLDGPGRSTAWGSSILWLCLSMNFAGWWVSISGKSGHDPWINRPIDADMPTQRLFWQESTTPWLFRRIRYGVRRHCHNLPCSVFGLHLCVLT